MRGGLLYLTLRQCWSDIPGVNKDIRPLLEDWPHEPGDIQARIIVGEDGSRLLQVRVDLGIIQMHMEGRPDGAMPHGCESLLDYHMQEAALDGDEYHLDEEECAKLQAEGLQYYHRYVSLMHLEEYDAVIRDTDRNLLLFDFVSEHADDPAVADAFEQFRPYVLMMRARAKASIAAKAEDYGQARKHLDHGKAAIRAVLEERGETPGDEESGELRMLELFEREIFERGPESRRERIEREMRIAIEQEAYERAAKLRDEIRAIDSTGDV